MFTNINIYTILIHTLSGTFRAFNHIPILSHVQELKYPDVSTETTAAIFMVNNLGFVWPRGLRRRSAAARLLRLLVRIPPRAWMSVVSVVCCQVEVSATSRSLVQRGPTDCVIECD